VTRAELKKEKAIAEKFRSQKKRRYAVSELGRAIKVFELSSSSVETHAGKHVEKTCF
jgi:hypothetical protein